MTIVLLAAHVLMSVPLVQFLRARSILSIPTSAQSAVLALMHVLLEQSLSKKDWRLPDGRNKIPCRKKQGIFVFLYVGGKVGTRGCLPYIYIRYYFSRAKASLMRLSASMMFSSLVAYDMRKHSGEPKEAPPTVAT